MKTVYRAILEALRAGEAVTLVSVVLAKGSAPRRAGALMAVFADGRAEGTVGGGAVEHAARRLALEGMEGPGQVRSYSLTQGDAAGLGMICGGDVTLLFHPIPRGDRHAIAVFEAVLEALEKRAPCWVARELRPDGSIAMSVYGDGGLILGEAFSPAPKLSAAPSFEQGERPRFVNPVSRPGRALIFGGGHVSRALSPILAGVEFPVLVFDDRPEFADIARFSGAVSALLCRMDDFSDAVSIGHEDFVVIVTRGHQADYEVLHQALRSPAAYIGMIGSRAKVQATKDRLMKDGFGWDDLARVYAPIGLEIGAETPEEIAVSIAAEMIKRRAQMR